MQVALCAVGDEEDGGEDAASTPTATTTELTRARQTYPTRHVCQAMWCPRGCSGYPRRNGHVALRCVPTWSERPIDARPAATLRLATTAEQATVGAPPHNDPQRPLSPAVHPPRHSSFFPRIYGAYRTHKACCDHSSAHFSAHAPSLPSSWQARETYLIPIPPALAHTHRHG